MPRYFFHSQDGATQLDKEGSVLPDLATAKAEAVKILGELLRHDPDLVLEGDGFRIIIQDDKGLTLYVVETSGLSAPAAGL